MYPRVLQNATKFEFDIWYSINLLRLLYKAKKVLVEVSQPCTLMGSGPLKFRGVTYYKGRKINFLIYSCVINQKKRLEPLMINQKSVTPWNFRGPQPIEENFFALYSKCNRFIEYHVSNSNFVAFWRTLVYNVGTKILMLNIYFKIGIYMIYFFVNCSPNTNSVHVQCKMYMITVQLQCIYIKTYHICIK